MKYVWPPDTVVFSNWGYCKLLSHYYLCFCDKAVDKSEQNYPLFNASKHVSEASCLFLSCPLPCYHEPKECRAAGMAEMARLHLWQWEREMVPRTDSVQKRSW